MTFPMSHASILEQFRDHLRSLKQRSSPSDVPANSATNKTVVIIDSIASCPGVYMPWKEMVQVCKEEGAYSVIDAAHSLGQEVGINLEKADPDFWVSVSHEISLSSVSLNVSFL